MSDEIRPQALSPRGKFLLGFYLALLMAGLSYFIAKLWPVAEAPRPVQLFGVLPAFFINGETRLILLSLSLGALGGCVHGATSFVGYAGNNKLYVSWVWYYLMRAPISATLALITYFVVRAGFFTASTSTSQISDFGIAAVSGLVGMFSKQATAKLDELFSSLFRTAKPEDLGDKLANRVPTLTSVIPGTIPAGCGDTEIEVLGDGYVDKSEVHWAGSRLETTFESAVKLTAIVPAEKLKTPGVIAVTVYSPAPGGGSSAPLKIVVTEPGEVR
jgi:hypothetical protein